MVSQGDTLKIARADMVSVSAKIGEAQHEKMIGNPRMKVTVQQVVWTMEQTAHRLRKSFKLEEAI